MAEYTWILNVASIFLVLIGWTVVFGNAKKIATRAESKAMADGISKIINEISELAIEFWLSSSRNGHNSDLYALTVMSKISQATQYSEIIKGRGIVLSDKTFSTMSLKATLDCETASTISNYEASIRAREVVECCTSAVIHVYETFETLHPPSDYHGFWNKFFCKCRELEQWQKSLGPH